MAEFLSLIVDGLNVVLLGQFTLGAVLLCVLIFLSAMRFWKSLKNRGGHYSGVWENSDADDDDFYEKNRGRYQG